MGAYPIHHSGDVSTSTRVSNSSKSYARPASRQAMSSHSSVSSTLQPQCHVQAVHAFDPASLPSTSAAAASNMYLCFKTGEIIKVWSKDEKGWWDGEVDRNEEEMRSGKGPRRGWFPSNYVKAVDMDTSPSQDPYNRPTPSPNPTSPSRQASTASITLVQRQQGSVSQASHMSQASTSHQSQYSGSTTTSAHHRHQVLPSISSLPEAYQAILHPVTQSLRLISDAIQSNHTSHFQPSAAVIISAIRTALEQTDCLSKTSPTLERFPQLARERKIVLVELSKLVACARAASGVDVPGMEQNDIELEVLTRTADGVLLAVLRVMVMAVDLGVQARPEIGETDEAVKLLLGQGQQQSSATPSVEKESDYGPARHASPVREEEEKTARWSNRLRSPPPANPRLHSAFKHRASSSADLRHMRRDPSPPPPLPASAASLSHHSSHSRSATNDSTGPLSASATHRSSSGSGRSSPVSSKSSMFAHHLVQSATHMSRVAGSIDSAISQNTQSSTSDGFSTPQRFSHSVNDSLNGATLQAQSLQTVEGMLKAITKAEDALFSIIAAFIGQIHSHSPTAHPSAHAGLVEMTRRTIDSIRDMLTVTETLGRTMTDEDTADNEVQIERLKQAKDGMYGLASRLVDAAEVLADAPFRYAERLGVIAEGAEKQARVAFILKEYERDRQRLVLVASEGLKHGGHCASVVRYCLLPGTKTPKALKLSPESASTSVEGDTPVVEVHITPDGDEDGTITTRRKERVGVRGVHTLSGLHRRVESLGQRGQQSDWEVDEHGLLGVPFGYNPAAAEEGRWDDAEDSELEELGADMQHTMRVKAQREASGAGPLEEMMNEGKDEDLTMRHVGLGFGLRVPTRPELLHAHSSPLLSTPQLSRRGSHSSMTSQELTPIPGRQTRSHSRSSSLSSPAPPRFAHRSPSRSADLDKFTSDLGGSLGPSQFSSRTTSAASHRDDETPGTSNCSSVDLIASRASVYTMASFASSSRQSLSGSEAARSSGISAVEQPVPQTPVIGQSRDDSPILGYLRAEASLNGTSFPRLGHLDPGAGGHVDLNIDAEKTPIKPIRPIPHRYPTSPIPQPTPAADVRFWVAAHDYDPREIGFNSEGRMIAASLKVLVEKMTPHDGPVDPAFAGMFWDTFRLFTSASQLVDEVLRRYECTPPVQLGTLASMGEMERAMWIERKVVPTRLRCCNFLKIWLEVEWRQRDAEGDVLDRLLEWNQGREAEGMPAMALRLGRLIKQRLTQSGRTQANAANGSEGHNRSPSRASSRSSVLSSNIDHRSRESGVTNPSISSLRGLRRSASFDRLRLATLSTVSLHSSGTGYNQAPYSPSSPKSPFGLPPTPIITKSLHSTLQKATSSSGKGLSSPIAWITNTSSDHVLSPDSVSGSTLPAAPTASLPAIPVPGVPMTEFEPLELARQLTIMESNLFRQLDPVELLLNGKKSSAGVGSQPVDELRKLSTLSNQITGFVADGVLGEGDAKKRAGLLKFWIKVADRCLMLQNYSSLFAILAGLNSSTILRLKKTWEVLSQKYRVLMDRLNGVIEHTRNHSIYRLKLREATGPILPFLGLILTDITFTCDGNPNTRPSLLRDGLMLVNVDKYVKLGKIAADFRRYQEPFNFHEIEAVQQYLSRALAERGSASLDALYRKSLLLEPRKGTEKLNNGIDRAGWLAGLV